MADMVQAQGVADTVSDGFAFARKDRRGDSDTESSWAKKVERVCSADLVQLARKKLIIPTLVLVEAGLQNRMVLGEAGAYVWVKDDVSLGSCMCADKRARCNGSCQCRNEKSVMRPALGHSLGNTGRSFTPVGLCERRDSVEDPWPGGVWASGFGLVTCRSASGP